MELFIKYLKKLRKIITSSIAIALYVLAILSFYPGLRDLPKQYGYEKWGEVLPDQLTLCYIIIGPLLIWLTYRDIKSIYEWIRDRNSFLKISDAAILMFDLSSKEYKQLLLSRRDHTNLDVVDSCKHSIYWGAVYGFIEIYGSPSRNTQPILIPTKELQSRTISADNLIELSERGHTKYYDILVKKSDIKTLAKKYKRDLGWLEDAIYSNRQAED